MSDLAGRSAFVSGAADNLGRAYARALAREGVNVALADIRFDPLMEARAEIEALGVKAIALPLDVTEASAMQLAARQVEAAFGKLHYVVNVPGVCCNKPILELTELDWLWLWSSNVMHLINATSAFLPLLKAHQEDRRILNMISMSSLGNTRGANGLSGYGITKHAALAYTKELHAALQASGVGVSALFPLKTRSELHAAWRHRQPRFGGRADANPPPAMGFDEWLAGGEDANASAPDLIRAIRENQLYVFSSGAMRDRIAAENLDLLAAMDQANTHLQPI